MISLRAPDDAGLRLAASWLAQPDNYQWLDFGGGRQLVTPQHLKLMHCRDTHLLRLFGLETGPAIGIVGLSDISQAFGTATLWFVLGERSVGRRGYTSEAVKLLLDEAFTGLGLASLFAWTVECNVASRGVLARNRFRLLGRWRACHVVDGVLHDRLLFDLLWSEHQNG